MMGSGGDSLPKSSPLSYKGICNVNQTPWLSTGNVLCSLCGRGIASAKARGETRMLSFHLGVALTSYFLYRQTLKPSEKWACSP